MKNKKIVSLLIASLLFTTCLSGCGKKDTVNNSNSNNNSSTISDTKEVDTDYKNYVYRGELVRDDLDWDVSFVPYEDGFYNVQMHYPDIEDEEMETFSDLEDDVVSEDTESLVDSSIIETDEENEWIVDYTIDFYDKEMNKTDSISFSGNEKNYGQLQYIDSDKNLYFSVSTYSDEKDETFILKTDKEGKEIYKQEFVSEGTLDYGSYIRNIFECNDTLYAFDGQSFLYPVDKETGKIGNAVYTGSDDRYADFYVVDDKIVVVENYYSSGIKVGTLDTTKKVVEYFEVEIPQDVYNFSKGYGNSLISQYKDSLYRLDIDNKKFVKVIDFIQSDVNSSDINGIVETDKGFYISFGEDDGLSLYFYTKVNPEDVKDKRIITLGCYYLPYQMRKNIIDFNKQNAEIRIAIKDYGQGEVILYDGDDTNSTPGLETLDKDIISGNVPDILVLSDYTRMNNYAKKGMFVDLNDFFTEENNIPMSDISDNIVNLFKTDDKVYILPTSYSVRTYLMKKSLYEKLQPYNIDTVNKFLKDKNMTESEFLGFMFRDYMLDIVLSGSGDKFIDLKNGTCNLDSKEFKDILSFVKNLPLSEDVFGDNYEYEDDSAYYREDRYVLSQLYLSALSDYTRQKYGVFGEDLEVVGMPGMEKVVSIYPEFLIGIVKNDNTNDSFEFVKGLFSEDKQLEDSSSFPVNKNALEKKFEEEKKGNYYLDNDKEVYYDDVYYIGDVEISIPKPSEEDINEVKDILNSINAVEMSDNGLSNILNEEISAFYSGDKSVDEVASIMQSRVSIYLAERK